jgi:hypothetical protein
MNNYINIHIAPKKIIKISYFYLFLMLTLVLPCKAQKACLQALENAENLYANGRPENVPQTLESCLKKGFDKEQQIRAYELVILSYLYLDDDILAADYMLELLKFEKEFELTGREPKEFKKLYNAFRTYPIFMLGIHTGANYTFVEPGKLYSLGETEKDSISYSPDPGFQIGVSTELQIGKHLLLNTGLNISQLNYSYSHRLFNFTRYALKEKQFTLNVPIGIKIATGGKKIKPYISLGASFDLLIKSDIQISRSFPNNAIVEITGQDINATAIRRKQNYHLFGGLGFKLKVPKSFLFFEARVSNGRLNQVNTSERYNNNELIYRYGHVDNDFSLNHVSVITGIQYNFYKPKIRGKYFYH